jgi:hypothetical protein
MIMNEGPRNHKIRLLIGCTALIVGVVATGLALYRWPQSSNTVYLLGSYAKYVCAFGGLLAAVTGLLIIRDFWQQNASSENIA